MKKKNKLFIEAAFTFRSYVKGITFRLVAILGVLLILVVLNIDNISKLLVDDTPCKIGITVSDTNYEESVFQFFQSNEHIEYCLIFEKEAKDEIEKMESMESDDATYCIIISFDIAKSSAEVDYSSNASLEEITQVNAAVEVLNNYINLSNLGFDDETISQIMSSNVIHNHHNSREGVEIINIVANCCLFLILMIYVAYLGSVIIEEKTSRISETLLSYITPTELMLGKLLGMLLALLLHLVLFVTIFLGFSKIFGTDSELLKMILSIFNVKTLVIMLLMLLSGYVCYGFLYMCNSSFVDTVQDSTVSSIIQTMLMVLSFYISFIFQLHFDESIVGILNYIPFISVFTNIVYVSVLNPSWLMICWFIFIQIIIIGIVGFCCAKGFRAGITRYGAKKMKWFKKA